MLFGSKATEMFVWTTKPRAHEGEYQIMTEFKFLDELFLHCCHFLESCLQYAVSRYEIVQHIAPDKTTTCCL